MDNEPRDYDEHAADDPFNSLRFLGCLGLLGAVMFLIGVGLYTAIELYAQVLP